MSGSKELRMFSDCMQAFSGSTGGRKNWRERRRKKEMRFNQMSVINKIKDHIVFIVHIHTFIAQWLSSLRQRNNLKKNLGEKWSDGLHWVEFYCEKQIISSVCSLEGILFTDIQTYSICTALIYASCPTRYDMIHSNIVIMWDVLYVIMESMQYSCFLLPSSDDIHPSVSDQRLEMKAGRSLSSYWLAQGSNSLISATPILWPC